jgi:exonuclease V gamma subunit
MEKIYLSNDLFFLYEKLKSELFKDKSFSMIRTVIVPSYHTKNWLFQKFASDPDYGGIMLLNFVEEKNIFSFLLNFFDSLARIPTILELDLTLQIKLKKMVEEYRERGDENIKNKLCDLHKLIDYLQVEGGVASKKEKRRLSALSYEMTSLFFTYFIFEKELELEKKPDNLWQKALWKELLNDFASPYRELLKPIKDGTNVKREFHLFNLPFLPWIYRQVFSRLSYPVFHYSLSPCKYFWEDISSEREKKAILKKAIKVEADVETIGRYLSDTNSLLANFGKIKREYLKILDSVEMESFDYYKNDEEHYLESNSWLNFTLLEAIKKDILNLRNIEEKGRYQIKKDRRSFQVHEVTSKLREVEALFDYIQNCLSENRDISPSDIKIYAPEIKEYLPFIHFVFGESNSKIEYKIFSLDNVQNSFFSQALFHFFSLLSSRWEKVDIFSLFENPSFMKKQGFCSEDLVKLKKWIDKSKVSWGIDSNHRKKILGKDLSDLHLKSWEHGFERVISSFIFDSETQDHLPYLPIKEMNFSEAELFNKFLTLFLELKKDFDYLESEKELSFISWVSFFKKIIDKYLYVDETKPDENQSYKMVSNFIDSLIYLSKKYSEEKLNLDSVLKILKRTLKKNSAAYNSSMAHGLSFYSWKEEILPAKISCFLGLDENIPSKEKELSFSYLSDKTKYLPNISDQDRNSFLDFLLLSENAVYLSYVGLCKEDGRKKMASSIVQELLFYIDQAFSMGEEKISSYIFFNHPPLSFDKSYFNSQPSSPPSASYGRFRGAKKYYLEEDSPYYFIRNFNKKPDFVNGGQLLPERLELKKLSSLSFNPIKFYLNEVLQIYLEREKEREYVKDFSLSFLDHYLIRKQILSKDIESILDNLEKEGELPFGIYKELAKEKIKEQSTLYLKNLKNLQIPLSDIKNIELETISMGTSELVIPPLEIKIDEKKIIIFGSLNNISSQGMILFSDGSLENLTKAWPEFLIFLKIKDQIFKNSSPSLIFLKSGKKLTFNNLEVDTFLNLYLRYFGVCLTNISPMIQGWRAALLTETEKEFEQVVKKSFSEKSIFEDIYFKWVFSRFENGFSPHHIYKNWSDYLKNTFRPVIT